MAWILGQFSLIVVVVLLGILAYSLKILREYERGVVFMLGRFWKVKGPGRPLRCRPARPCACGGWRG